MADNEVIMTKVSNPSVRIRTRKLKVSSRQAGFVEESIGAVVSTVKK